MGSADEGVERTLSLDASSDKADEIWTKWYESLDERADVPHPLEALPGIDGPEDIYETDGGLETISVSLVNNAQTSHSFVNVLLSS